MINIKFEKYPSIENSYREKYINNWLVKFPELEMEEFIITEKIHGANFQIFITPDDFRFGKRNSFIKEDEKFFGYEPVMEKYTEMIMEMQFYLKENNYDSMRMFGELFGSNIQKGVDYGEKKKFKVFDIYIEDRLLSQKDAVDLINDLGYGSYYVPIITVVEGIKKALEFDAEFDTLLSDKEDNICEGVVIKPYRKAYTFDGLAPFHLKVKNKKFLERASKSNKPKVAMSDKFKEVQDIYADHLTDNRLQGIFSKYGEINEPKQMGEYIEYMLEDAKEDFLKDYMDEFMEVPSGERSKIFSSSGSVVAPMLHEYL